MDTQIAPQVLSKDELLELVKSLSTDITLQEKADRAAVIIPLDQWLNIAKQLKSDSRFLFDMLSDHTAIDWPEEQIIELVYQLYSVDHHHHLMVCIKIPRAISIAPSVSELWPIAEWQEREVFDLFGVKYSNHPDLRRIFLEDDWQGHPLLKDYKDEFMLERPW